MARVLALEWDEREARAVVGNVSPNAVTFEHAFAIPIADDSTDSKAIGQAIANALTQRNVNVSNIETLVALGRSATELRVLSLPPAETDDLPDLVRYQAQREFSSRADDWPLDFVELGRSDTAIEVLATATSPQTVDTVRAICSDVGGGPTHLILRPFAAASLWHRTQDDAAS